ncbi:hypothetical protein [Vibrio crassostreae]|uniref:hypothetical protein n=1 Tax=Vibrio crassostreae TaxID=246167 RepID=UPI001B305D3F|nr:hypothetical protein [Vibrio crassostreae]
MSKENTESNESSIASLAAAIDQNKNKKKGVDALDKVKHENNKSIPSVSESKDAVGKRRNVYFTKKSLESLSVIEDADGVAMSAAVQAALHMFASASDKKREAVYSALKIKCNFDD